MRRVLVALLLGAGGCGLDMAGLGAPDVGDAANGHADGTSGTSGEAGGSTGDDGGGTGAEASAPEGGQSIDGASPSCVTATGWTAVYYETALGPCPAGTSTSKDEVASATAGSGACGCSCTISPQPSCESGTLGTQWAQQPGPGACPNAGVPLSVNGGNCTSFAGQSVSLAGAFSATPVAPTAASCTGAVEANTNDVTKNRVRLCDVPQAQADTLCTAPPPGGFAACVTAPGDVACPAGPFATKTLVSDDTVLLCPSCGACKVTATCTGAQVTFYGDGACGGVVATVPASGACVSTGQGGGQGVAAFKYSAQVQASCSASPSGTASLEPVQPRTVCCR